MDQELENFKKSVNIVEYASLHGYIIDKEKSTSIAKQLKHFETGNKIVVSKNAVNGHYMYFSMSNDTDNGTIVDFIQNRFKMNLGQLRKELRSFLRSEIDFTNRDTQINTSHKVHRDFTALWNKIDNTSDNNYIGEYRNISNTTISKALESGRVLQKGNDFYFMLSDTTGICGIEKRSNEGKALIKDSKKGLWTYGSLKSAKRVIYAESPIDALSYMDLHGKEGDYLVSTGGSLSEDQKLSIRAITRHNPKAELICITDNDNAGDQIAQQIVDQAKSADRSIQAYRHAPEHGKDWNETLKYHREQEELKKQQERKKHRSQHYHY